MEESVQEQARLEPANEELPIEQVDPDGGVEAGAPEIARDGKLDSGTAPLSTEPLQNLRQVRSEALRTGPVVPIEETVESRGAEPAEALEKTPEAAGDKVAVPADASAGGATQATRTPASLATPRNCAWTSAARSITSVGRFNATKARIRFIVIS